MAAEQRSRVQYMLVLDLEEFWVWCGACHWRSPGYPTPQQARAACNGHICPPVPRLPESPVHVPLSVRLVVTLAELRELRLHRCLVCGHIGLRLRPAKRDMPRAWARTWVCPDRAACRQRQRRRGRERERG